VRLEGELEEREKAQARLEALEAELAAVKGRGDGWPEAVGTPTAALKRALLMGKRAVSMC